MSPPVRKKRLSGCGKCKRKKWGRRATGVTYPGIGKKEKGGIPILYAVRERGNDTLRKSF